MDFDFNRPHSLTYRGLDVAWPRCLLHIPTMTSIERTGTSTYLKTNSPQYAIITYTWGRFRAPAGYPALPVKGTSWKIPPVKDTCFSVKSFQRAIENIGKRYEWLWLDVTCIDQENESVKMSEVARQVGIFHGAAESYAWLHSLKSKDAAKNIAVLAKLGSYNPLGEDHIWSYASEGLRLRSSFDVYRAQLDVVQSALQFIFTDPWFTSLWTLQESILRRDAQLLSADGEPILYNDDEAGSQMRACTIALLNGWCYMISQDFYKYSNEGRLSASEQAKVAEIMTLVKGVGFNFTAAVNPNVQYGAARFRETEYPLDRIYGIMGIYRTVIPETYQLPVPSATTIDGLELAFASALNQASPWLAQCFVHLQQPVAGRSWCITQTSTVPSPFEDFNSNWAMEVESQFVPRNSGLATAQGKACPLKVLWAYWLKTKDTGMMSGLSKLSSNFAVAYDQSMSAVLAPPQPQQEPSPIVEWIDQSSQNTQNAFKATRRLLDTVPIQDLYILHMARSNTNPNPGHVGKEYQRMYPKIRCITNQSGTRPPEQGFDTLFNEQGMTWGLQWEMTSIWDSDRKALGVILLRDNSGQWKRIGICTWIEMPHTEHNLRNWTCEVR